jgi:acetoin utilization protein AcuB
MLVKDWMIKEPIVVSPRTSVEQAMRTMREHWLRHLPVVAEDKTIVGVVTQTDLLQASPLPATSLSTWEINSLLAKMEVRDAMTRKVVVVSEECPLEEAALVMAERKIGCLPVVQGTRLVGIITETDLFNILTEQLSARRTGVRLVLLIPDVKGELARLAGYIAQAGGNIVRLTTLPAEDPAYQVVTVKVEDVPQEALVSALSKVVAKILDVREHRDPGTSGYTPYHWILET